MSDTLASAPASLAMAAAARDAGDLEAALRIWAACRAAEPTAPSAYTDAAKALYKAGNFDAAQALLEDGLKRCPNRLVLLIEHAWVAHYRGHHEEALARWSLLAEEFPNHGAGYIGVGRMLLALRQLERADSYLQAAIQKFPGDPHLAETFARVASAREHWGEALARWDALAAIAPLDASALRDRGLCVWQVSMTKRPHAESGSAQATSAGTAQHAGPVEIGRTADPEINELVKCFESIGQNCEFGLVQRHFQAEPIDLLRWTGIDPEKLIALLEAQCAGLGDRGNLVLGRTPWNEHIIHDSKFGIGFHTFLTADIENETKFLAHQSTRIRWLRKVLLDSLATGRKTFVYKLHQEGTETQMLQVHDALRRYGPNRLLWVVTDTDRAPGSVEQIRPGLLRGYLSRTNPNDRDEWNIPFDQWIAICRQARLMAGT
jgi:tetratricopeptide (TPR) repeat protein